ncbi:hypothetical protein [Vibrio sp. TBV020]|uniref:hypothetical protein n=1 Tax=Vibrio sp. TBV020 TaxID=3137398 RepID=UPI0038CDBEF6
MAKPKQDKNWPALNRAFQTEHLKTGITVKRWCEKNGINPNSAKRYIKRPPAPKGVADGRTKNTQEVEKAESNQGDPSCDKVIREAREFSQELSAGMLGNTNQKTHGFYAEFMDEEDIAVLEKSHKVELDAELGLMRVRAVRSMRALKIIASDIEDSKSIEQRVQLYDQYIKMEGKLDWAIQRIESLTHTIADISEKSVLLRLKMKKLNSSADKDLEQIKLIRKQVEEKGVIIDMRKNNGDDDKVTYEIDW